MPVVQRGSSWQAAIYCKGERARQSFPSQADAEAWEAMVKERLGRGLSLTEAQAPEATAETLQDLFNLTSVNVWGHAKSAHLLINNGRRVVEAIGPDVPVGRVRRAEIDKAVSLWRAAGNSNGTLNRKLAALSRMLSYAVELEIIVAKPHIPRFKEAEGKMEWWSEELEARVLAWFAWTGELYMRDYCIVSLDTGMRQSEVLRLTHGNVCLDRKTITVVDDKSGSTRVIPMTDRVHNVLRIWCEKWSPAPLPEQKVFGGRLSANGIRRPWDRMSQKINDPMVGTPHTMRHTFGSRLVQRGAPLQRVKDLMGHSTMQMTMRYAKLAPENLSATIDLLN